ncbi:hypothetical protein TIFTF001_006045 [Ficus carica]|uniref:Wax synthase domain-containing protein n=1 Tax=Ficus carica TaxID=3494 RepID=A0AA87ZGJ6_FICCA|nr:hypothetical protein TIFTF001_006045 [Ficus carica]
MSKVEEELKNFGTVWMTIVASLCFCYSIAKIIKQGATRFFVLLPVMLLFLVISLKLNTVFLGSLTCFFISWLATFKLLLFAFGKGPLSSDPPHSLLSFISLACFPIKFQENPDTPTLKDDDENYPVAASQKTNKKGQKPLTSYWIKALLLATIIFVHQNKSSIHTTLFLFLYSIYVYTCLEIILAIVAAMVRVFLAVELEPQFDDPYLATSVQDFWSRRWNIMVSKVLRSSVYIPVRTVSKYVVGENWAAIPAIVAVFIVSGIMHEWVFYIIGMESQARSYLEVQAPVGYHGLLRPAWRLHVFGDRREEVGGWQVAAATAGVGDNGGVVRHGHLHLAIPTGLDKVQDRCDGSQRARRPL